MTFGRALLLAALALAGCNSLSSENEGLLASYLDNAERYFDGGEYERAFNQWDKALALDSSNEGARLGQAMCFYENGRAESPASIKPLSEATERLEKMSHEDFDKMQWKVELGLALVHQRWCDLYDRKIRRLNEQKAAGVAVDAKELAIAESEFKKHLDASEKSFKSVMSGDEKEPRDRLTCWVGMAQIAHWRNDPQKSLHYCDLYLEQVVNSKRFWQQQADNATHPADAQMLKGKFAGAQRQEADLRDLMGAVLYQMGKKDEAEKQLDEVVAIMPERASTYLNRGIIRQDKGDDDLARSDFQKFLAKSELPDNDPSVLEAERRLKEVEQRIRTQDAKDAAPR